MFDDLDDDGPFQPGPDFRAGVARRAAALRRRAVVLRAAGAVGVLAVVAGGIALTLREDDTEGLRVVDGTSTTSAGPTTSTSLATTSTTASGPLPPRVIVTWHGVLGAWFDGEWVDQDRALELVHPGERYQVVGLAETLGFANGSEPVVGCSQDGAVTQVELAPALADLAQEDIPQPQPLAVSGPGELFPRPVTELENATPYRDAVATALRAAGVEPGEPNIRQIVRADLEGDGTDEVLIVAEQRHDPDGADARLGDYSAVLVRRIVDGEVRTEVLTHHEADDMGSGRDDSMAFLNLFAIDVVADLNGDGSLEVVVQTRYYEGGSAVLYALGPDGLDDVDYVGCGA